MSKVFWTGNAGDDDNLNGNFSDADNWTGNVVPGRGDQAFLAAGEYRVVLQSSVAEEVDLKSLEVGRGVKLLIRDIIPDDSQSVDLHASKIKVRGELDLQGSEIDVHKVQLLAGGQLKGWGSLVVGSGHLQVEGRLIASGDASHSLQVSGTLDLTGHLVGSGLASISDLIIVESAAAVSVSHLTAGSLLAYGDVDLSHTDLTIENGNSNVGVAFTNYHGTATLSDSSFDRTFVQGASLINTGHMTFRGDSLINEDLTNNGDIRVEQSSEGSRLTIFASPEIKGTGSITLDQGTNLLLGCAVSANQTIHLSGSNVVGIGSLGANALDGSFENLDASDKFDFSLLNPYTDKISLTYKADADPSSGTLTIVDSDPNDPETSSIHLIGHYQTSDFSLSSDSLKGLYINYNPSVGHSDGLGVLVHV